jgi:hypothetical protein
MEWSSPPCLFCWVVRCQTCLLGQASWCTQQNSGQGSGRNSSTLRSEVTDSTISGKIKVHA